jgi:hypothetical protein
MMKNYKAQGELSIIPLVSIPKNKKVELAQFDNDGSLIVGHSETGHHHVLDSNKVELIASEVREGIERFFIFVKESTQLMHRRPIHQHAPIDLEANQYYEIRGGREFDPATSTSVRIQAD